MFMGSYIKKGIIYLFYNARKAYESENLNQE